MPIPEQIDWMDANFYIRAEWRLCRVLWPHRCEISGKWLWPGTQAYRGTAVWTGPGEPVIEHRWHDSVEHLIWRLKE